VRQHTSHHTHSRALFPAELFITTTVDDVSTLVLAVVVITTLLLVMSSSVAALAGDGRVGSGIADESGVGADVDDDNAVLTVVVVVAVAVADVGVGAISVGVTDCAGGGGANVVTGTLSSAQHAYVHEPHEPYDVFAFQGVQSSAPRHPSRTSWWSNLFSLYAAQLIA
jgi:hypothetical protein